jgi:8-oxo-dGTP pyrophosphatase MutT (NUDIX family)
MDRTTRYIAAILKDNHILLLAHQFTDTYTCWEIPGGGRLEGESEADCIVREVREEAGLDVHVDGLLNDGPSHPHTFYQRFKIFHCTPLGEPNLGSSAAREKILEARWFDLRVDTQLLNDIINSAITSTVINRIRWALKYDNATNPLIIPTELRCENEFNPINLDTPLPRLSWVSHRPERGQVQTAYQILVTDGKDILWDSGKIVSTQQMVEYGGAPLTSRQWACWQVRVWDNNDDPGPFSESSWFRLGLLWPTDWHAEWIGYPADSNGETLYFRRTFNIEKPVRSAWVYLAGSGYAELHLNGEKVGDHLLEPCNTDYDERVLYTTYNLRPFLYDGMNLFGVIIGNGWHGLPVLLLQAEFEYEDGTSLRVCTENTPAGPNWMVGTGPILENSTYDGEAYDARLERPGWDSALTIELPLWDWAVVTDGPGGKLVSQRTEPLRLTSTLQPKLVTQPKPGVYVFDLEQNIAGWARLRVKGDYGDQVTLQFAESLNKDGTVTQENLRRVRATDIYILKGTGEEVWEPRFSYHKFRYVQVEGAAESKIEGVSLEVNNDKHTF